MLMLNLNQQTPDCLPPFIYCWGFKAVISQGHKQVNCDSAKALWVVALEHKVSYKEWPFVMSHMRCKIGVRLKHNITFTTQSFM